MILFYIILFVSIGYLLGSKLSYVSLFLIIPIAGIWANSHGDFWGVATGIELIVGIFIGIAESERKKEKEKPNIEWAKDLMKKKEEEK